MPIELRPAAPFSPAISTAAGETDQFTRLAPLIEQHQQAVAQAYAQQRRDGMQFASANADRMQQGSQFAAQQDQQRQMQEAQLGQQAAQQDAQRQQQQTQHEQQIQAQLDMQRNEFTYKDNLELQRYKNGLSEIENSPNLTPEERADMRVQFATKIDPMERKLAQAKIAQEQTHNKVMQEQLAQQHIITERSKQFEAQSLPERIKTLTDPTTGVTGQFYLDKNGDPHSIFDTVNAAALKAKQLEADNAEKVAAKEEKGQRMHEESVTKYRHTVGEAFAKIDKDVTHEVNAEEKNHPNPATVDWEGRKNTLIQRRQEAYLKGNPEPKPAGGQVSNESSTRAAPDQPPITDTARPTPAQAATLQDMEAVRAAFAAVPRDQGRTPPEAAEATAKLQRAESLFRKYGDPLNMPEATRRDYLESLNAAVAAGKKFTARTTPPPRKPGLREDEKGNLVPDDSVPFHSIRRRDGSLMRVLK